MPEGRKSSRDRKVDPKREEKEEVGEENGGRISSGGSRGHVRTPENIYIYIYTHVTAARGRGSVYGAFTGSGYGNREPK